MIHVCWATANPTAGERGAWDMGIVEELTASPEYEHRAPDLVETKQWTGETVARALVPSWGDDGAVVVVAGQHNAKPKYARAVFSLVDSLPWALTIVTSDEEALFPVDLLPRDEHHAVWNQYHDRGMDRVIPIGASPPFMEAMQYPSGNSERRLAVSFAGQDTHERRHELLAVMKEMAADGGYGNIAWIATTGFRQGLNASEYAFSLRNTRIAPCPSGPHSLDSFRLYEALAAGCLPVIEAHTPHGDEHEFWDALLGKSNPIPMVDAWTQLRHEMDYYSDPMAWQAARDEVQRWWEGYREDLAIDFECTIARLRQS